MACGCGGSAGKGPLLSGVLGAQYGADAGGVESVLAGSGDGVAAESLAPSISSTFSTGFWIVVGLVIVAAVIADRERRRSE